MPRTKRKINPLLQTEEVKPVEPAVRKYKVGGYVRLSVEDGGKPGADTLDNQRNLILGYINSQSDMELAGVWCDNGQTGTDFERPEFDKLMAKVKTGEIDCIAVKDLSRFGRNYKETGNYLERIFPFLGVRFIAINDNFDTLTAERGDNGYIVPLKNLINEVYSKDISKKSGSALATKQKRGEFIGAWAPYGYMKDPNDKHRLIVNEETAPTVKRIFAWRAEGISVVQIARRLNDAGIPSPSAYLYNKGEVKTEKYRNVPWNNCVLKSILSHQVYLGHMVQGKKHQSFYNGQKQMYTPESEWKVVENTHEPLIDQETFDKVQEIAKQRHDEYHERLGKYDAAIDLTENILKGLVYCAECGKPLVRYKNARSYKTSTYLWYSYICPTHANDPKACPFSIFSESELHKVVFDTLQKQIALAVDMDKLTRELNESPEYRKSENNVKIRLANAKRALKRSQSLYESLYQSYVEQLMTEQEYVTLKARYKAEADEAARVIAELERQSEAVKQLTPDNSFLQLFGRYTGVESLTKELASALIERIYIDGKYNIRIVLKCSDEYEQLKNYIQGKE